jgi:acyl-coenzyme A thioesterase PaaI-like protein
MSIACHLCLSFIMSTPSTALAQLAASVRRLIATTVTVDAPPAALAVATAAVDRIVMELRAHVPDPPPPRYPGAVDPTDPGTVFPYDAVMGPLNPLAVPVQITWEPPQAVGRVCFDTPYEGPPGCVHGAVIAATFDQIFNVANLMQGTAGPTAKLELHFRKPTPLRTALRFEGWRERVEDRKVYAAGRLLAGDTVTVEAAGLFVLVSPERVMKLLGG